MDNIFGAYEGHVKIAHYIETIGSTGDEKPSAHPQYMTTDLRAIPDDKS